MHEQAGCQRWLDDNILNLWNFTYVGKLSCITVDIIINKILLGCLHKKYSKLYCFSKHYLKIEKRACILKIIQYNAQKINLPRTSSVPCIKPRQLTKQMTFSFTVSAVAFGGVIALKKEH